MSLLQVSNLSFSFPGQDPLFEEVELELHPGWYGLVGANGAGKTTLFRLLAGELTPDSGSIRRVPEDARLLVCPQTVEEPTASIASFAADHGAGAFRLRGRLDLHPAELSRWPTLSPGERKRWQIGAALFDAPELLLLDEPTNHLDRGARDLLISALARYAGIGILIAHDRTLLDALTKRTLRLADRRLTEWPGPYGKAREVWEQAAQVEGEQRAALKKRERALSKKLQSSREERDRAERSRSARHRMRNEGDREARSMGARALADWAEARIGRNVELTRRDLERVRDRIAPGSKDKTIGRSVYAEWAPSPRAHLLSIDAETIEAGGQVILREVRVSVGREDRIRVVGPNGAGKTTLLRALLDRSTLPPERLLHLPQELPAAESRSLLERVKTAPREVRGRVLSIVAALGCDPDALLASSSPSPGEARKLALALGLGRHAWALILDEPTNHLDLGSIERLEQALSEYPGALVIVTHDEHFASATTTTQWQIGRGRVST